MRLRNGVLLLALLLIGGAGSLGNVYTSTNHSTPLTSYYRSDKETTEKEPSPELTLNVIVDGDTSEPFIYVRSEKPTVRKRHSIDDICEVVPC